MASDLGLSEYELGMLLSRMSPGSCAATIGRSEAWVRRKRALLEALAADEEEEEPEAVEAPSAAEAPSASPPPAAPQSADLAPAPAPEPAPEPAQATAPGGGRLMRNRTPRWAQHQDMQARETFPDLPHPADVQAGKYERTFVREKRAAGVSWQNIARMLKKCERQLRADHGAFTS